MRESSCILQPDTDNDGTQLLCNPVRTARSHLGHPELSPLPPREELPGSHRPRSAAVAYGFP